MSARLVVSLVMLCGVALAGGGSARAQSRETAVAPGLGRYHALVIGNQAYRHLKTLTTPIADARAVAALLSHDYGFASVRVLTNATRAESVRALDDLRQRLTDRDNLLIYYAGHGWLDREADRGYWLPIDAEADSRANWLSTVDITDTLRALRAKHVLVVADSCYGGTLTRNIGVQPLGAVDVLRLAQKRARTALTSGGLEPVADRGGGGHSVFARAFLDALRGAQRPTDLASLFGGIRRQVLLHAEQTPEYSDIRQAGHDGGDFIFVRPGTRLAAVPPPLDVREEPRPQVGSLALSARLDGVEVWLGDQRVGETRLGRALVVSNVPEGAHRLRARKAGHTDWEREVRVVANQRAEVLIDIEPLRTDLPKVIRGDDGAEMVLVPAGEFLMGSDERNAEKPRHRVSLDAFHIDKYEVTNARFERFVRATRHQTTAEREGWSYVDVEKDGKWQWERVNRASWQSPDGVATRVLPDHPVVQVSWSDARAYCNWAGKRLPTEAEWEKAARGADGRKYPWGEQWDTSKANSGASKLGKTVAVGSYPSGASPYGAHDMAGNVWEWVADWYDEAYYQRSRERNPRGPDSGTWRVVRGGSWSMNPVSLRPASRFALAPELRVNDVGFRCAKSAL